jgi:hypothetical protein
MAKKQPKFDQVIRDVRVRVYASRTEYEVLFGSTREIEDREAHVLVYPAAATKRAAPDSGSVWFDDRVVQSVSG